MTAGILSVTIAAALGIAVGVGTTGSRGEAAEARDLAFDTGYESSFNITEEDATERGLQEGEDLGTLDGRASGRTEGFDLGSGVAGLDLVAEQIEAAESARITAEAELADRQANCGSIPSAPDTCPTSAELAEYQAAVAAAKKPQRPDRPRAGPPPREGAVLDG